ncbi:MAG: DUF885 domain-containing protein, partial [Sphingomonas sp.]
VSPATSPAAALARLFAESDAAYLERNPREAIARGDLRHADRYGDGISDAWWAAERKAAEDDLKRLSAIDRAALTPAQLLDYDTFAWLQRDTIAATAPAMLAIAKRLPLDHMGGAQANYPTFASGQGTAPFATLADYENNLKRHEGYVAYLDASIARMREGMAAGIVQPKIVVRAVIGQLDGLIAQGVEESSFYGPIERFPAAITPADRKRLTAAYASAIRDRLTPAHRRLRAFLVDTYLPAARDTVGISALPGGAAFYANAIAHSTTRAMTADEVHALGLSEVARIRGEMDAIRTATGFAGDLPAFFELIRTDPRFKPKSREALTEAYRAIGLRVDARVREQFSTIPRSALEIRPYEPYREKSQPGGSYEPGSPDGKRPGIFYFNAYDLPSRTTPGMETLYLHEAVPGHHFQISVAQENPDLPAFMRFRWNTAYVEGWALYAETLWKPLGMETDPYARFGGLDDEMLRAMRLVVDSGLHAKGWTRDRAIAYMLANSGMGRTDATAEVERYIAWPGQALAYKVGQLTISRLKAKAQDALGARFDPRAFHAQVLESGSLPMSVLETKIDRWIAQAKAAPAKA